VEKALGALPVIAQFCRRLDLAGIVDRACPVRDVAPLTHGQVIEILVANRLTSPSPLVHIEQWAREWAVKEVFGITPDLLNDDRCGRALEAIAPKLDHIIGSVGAAAIAAFGVDVARLHWDMTSICLYGAFDHPDQGFALPATGRAKDGTLGIQVQAGLAVAADGGIPIFHHAYDGRAAEVAQVTGAMTALETLAEERSFLLVGDSKLVSYDNVAALLAAGVSFIAPASKTLVPTSVLSALDATWAVELAYVAERDRDKPAEERGYYLGLEDTMELSGPRKNDPVLTVRRVFVYSSARADAVRLARVRKLERARQDLDRLTHALGTRHYRDQASVTARINVISRQRRVGAYLRTAIGTDEGGKPTLSWKFDQAAIDADAAGDGWYALLTDLSPTEADTVAVLARYKGQEVVERRYGDFKGPLAVAPMFLKNNRRITALISVICLALLVFCLVERAVRLALSPAVQLAGLWAGQPAKPTGHLIFTALNKLRLTPATGTTPPLVAQPPLLQARILELLNVDATRSR
jgi:transposase